MPFLLRCLSSLAKQENQQTWRSLYSFTAAGVISSTASERFVSLGVLWQLFDCRFQKMSFLLSLTMNQTHQAKPSFWPRTSWTVHPVSFSDLGVTIAASNIWPFSIFFRHCHFILKLLWSQFYIHRTSKCVLYHIPLFFGCISSLLD